jgi:RNA polymerase sigma factor (sigma-70 family)
MDDTTVMPAKRVRSAGAKLKDDEILDIIVRAQNNDHEAFGELYEAYSESLFRYVRNRVADHFLAEDLTSEVFLRALRGISGFKWQGHGIDAWLITIARNLVTDYLASAQHLREMLTAVIHESEREGSDLDDLAAAVSVEHPQHGAPGDPEHFESGGIDLQFVQGCDHADLAVQLGTVKAGGRIRDRQGTDLLMDRAVEHAMTKPSAEDVVIFAQFVQELHDAVLRLPPRWQECLILRSFHDQSVAQTAWIIGCSEGSVKMMQLRAVRSLAKIFRV